MTHNVDEQLSCLLDDQLSSGVQDRLLEALKQDPALRQKWSRMNLVRATLQRHAPPQVDINFADRVMASLAAQEPPVAEVQKPANNVVRVDFRRWLRPLGGLALAASVAMLAVMTVKPSNTSNLHEVSSVTNLNNNTYSISRPTAPVVNVALGASPSNRSVATLPLQLVQTIRPTTSVIVVHDWAQLPEEVQQRLNDYMVSHGANAGVNNPALLPRARLIGFDEVH